MTARPSTVSAFGALAATVSVLLAACSGGNGTPKGASSLNASSSKQGGTLSIGSSVAPPTLDSTSNAAAAITEVVDYNVYQHLVQLNPKGQVVPVLATSYSLSADHLTYTFNLRPGVAFSNGDPLTADDVVFSLKRAIAPTSTYPNKAAMGTITSITAPSPTQVAVTLAQPNNQWLYQLAAYSNGVVLDPTAVASMATSPVGTGPYTLSNFLPNYSITLTRNPHYWGSPPGVSEVVFRYFSSDNAENAALTSGQIQVMDNLSNSNPAEATPYKGNPQFKIIAGPTTGKIQLTLNNQYGPLKNVLVRRAIAYAIDKAAIVQTSAAGYGTVLGSNTVPGDPWYSPSYASIYAYNPNKARQLLAQAGYPQGFHVTLTLPPYGYAQSAGPLLVAELKAIGVDATIQNIQWPLWLTQVFKNHDYQMTIVNQALGRDLVHYAIPTYYFNYQNYAAVAKLLALGNAAPTTSQEIQYYSQALTTITNDAVAVWIYDPSQVTVARSNVVGLPDSGLAASFDLSHVSIGGTLASGLSAQGYAG